MSTRHAQLMKRFGLERMDIPGATAEIIQKRIAGLWEVAYHGGSIEYLPTAIRRFGGDCYLQGLLDATSPTMRARIEKLALEGAIPPMDPSR